ncbi:MAG: choice-of-anchor K domain-containing protein [Verrucomicrobiales bacterium]
MKFIKTISKIRGHSLVEMVTAVGVIAAVAGVCLALVGRFKEGSDTQKLEADLAMLNRAASVYLANGGAFESTTDVDTMLAKLKTYPLSTQRQSIVGLRGPMVDMRVKAVPMTTEEEATSRPRAVWNSDHNRLALVTSGPGIKEFILGSVPPIIEEVRKSTVEYASVSDWVWDYGTDGANDRPGYGGNVSTSDESPLTSLGGGGGGGGGAYNPGDYTSQLEPPVFSIPGGFYEYYNFPLMLTLSNPNDEGTSRIIYSIGGGGWELYLGGQIVVPGDYSTSVRAYCESADYDFWTDSEVAEQVFETLYISGSSNGNFESPEGGEHLVYDIEETENGSIFSWGTPAHDHDRPSSLHFEGTSFENISPEQEFEIGTLTFYNGTILSGTGADGVELELDLDLTVNIPIATQEITFTFELINTPNYSYQSNDANADYVLISVPREEFTTTFNGVTYYIEISFGEIGEHGFSTTDEFHVWEDHEATGAVIAKITTEQPSEYDTISPAVVLSTLDTTVNGQFEVHANFSEVVNGFAIEDIQVVNGSKTSLHGNGIDYSFFVNPASDGLVTVKVPAGRVVDGNGNANTESNLLEVIADLTHPTPTLTYTQVQSGYKNNNGHGNNVDGVDVSNPGQGGGGPNGAVDESGSWDDEMKGGQGNPYPVTGPITVDLTFDEPVTGFSFSDFAVSGATLSNLSGSGSSFSMVVTMNENADTATVKLESGAAIDGVGNGSLASNTIYLYKDLGNPGITLTTASNSVEGSFVVNATTSEKAYGFDITDIVAVNGVVSNFSAQGNKTNFSFLITPQAVGNVNISVPNAAFADDALNTNIASNTLTVAYTATSYIDFNNYAVNSHAGWQDQGSYSIQDSGATLYIKDNAWKEIDYNTTIAANTVLEFEFYSNKRGEIHSIGFDTDSELSATRSFQVYGTQDWGIDDFQNYSSNDGWKSYLIPVGQYFTGSFTKMVFAADHDSNPGNARSKFRNVRVYTP